MKSEAYADSLGSFALGGANFSRRCGTQNPQHESCGASRSTNLRTVHNDKYCDFLERMPAVVGRAFSTDSSV